MCLKSTLTELFLWFVPILFHPRVIFIPFRQLESRLFRMIWTGQGVPQVIDRTQPIDTGETSPNSQQRLARFAFVGVVVLLVVIFLVRNVDRYEDLNTEFRYS